MPIFWWGLLLILLFSVQLGWTPVSGRIARHVLRRAGHRLHADRQRCSSGEQGAFRSALSHLILPTIVLGTIPLAVIARMTRSAMLEVLGEDYIRTARAKGLPPLRVVGVHALRNALIPVVTVIGLQVGVLFAGAILTETIFSWPGVGNWLIEAISRRDYPVLQGGMLLIGVDRHGGQPARRRDLRRHQSAHPARAMTAEAIEAAAVAAPAAAPPQPLREFWRYFSANRGAVVGPRRDRRAAAAGAVRRRRSRRIRPISPIPRRSCKPPVWQEGGSLRLSARHRRGRPRHPLAPDLRRAAVAADRPRRGRALARRRHRARPGRRLLRAASIEIADHAADGHHPGAAEPAARDRRSSRSSGPA